MLISIHQPYYIPWMGLFHKIYSTDAIVLLDHVQYADKDMQNRNYIKTPNGKLMLSVPVLLPKFDTKALDIEINNAVNWRRKHWMSIKHSYSKSEYFNDYAPFFENLFDQSWPKLIDLNIEIIQFMVEQIGLKTRIIRSSELNITKHKNEQLVEICQKVGADAFLTGSTAAKEYLDFEIFSENGIKLFVHDFNHPVYPQMHGEFIEALSAIDLLFNCGKESIEIIAKGGARPE